MPTKVKIKSKAKTATKPASKRGSAKPAAKRGKATTKATTKATPKRGTAKKTAAKKSQKTGVGRKPNISDEQILKKLGKRGHKTAAELGVTIPRMRQLEADGLVEAVGLRQTGERGRPAIEWSAA